MIWLRNWPKVAEMYEISVGAARISKYASRESGDSLEVVERPNGGICVALSDGQGSGKAAHILSSIVTARAVALVKEGARDEAAALAANDHLFATRHGQVSATLVLLSADPVAGTLSIARNSATPVYVLRPVPPPAEDPTNPLADPPQPLVSVLREAVMEHHHDLSVTAIYETIALAEEVAPLGLYRSTRPHIVEMELAAPSYVVAMTDGIQTAGEHFHNPLDMAALIEQHIAAAVREGGALPTADALADLFISQALERDKGRAADDMSVAVLRVVASDVADGAPMPRRLHLSAVVQSL